VFGEERQGVGTPGLVDDARVERRPTDPARLVRNLDGVWDGERILPEGWVDYTRTPAPAAKYKHYGALFWLNAGAKEFANAAVVKTEGRNTPPFPRLPEDAYFMMGHDGQVVAIIPSRDLVVVRLGLSRSTETWDYEGFLADVLAAIHEA